MTSSEKAFCFIVLLSLSLLMLGCGSTEIVSPEIAEQASGLSSSYEKAMDAHATRLATALAEQKRTGEMTLESAQKILAQLEKIEAYLADYSVQNRKEVIQPSTNPPAKANTTPDPLKVATPGDSSETLSELATRLYGQGVSVHMKTREELEAIDAQLKAGQPVTGAIFQNNRTSAVTSQRSAVRPIPRRSGVVQWQNYSTQSTCGPNGCTPKRSR